MTVLRKVQTKYWLSPSAKTTWGITNKVSAAKFCEAAWKLQNWVGLFLFGLYVCSSKPWFTNKYELWTAYPHAMTLDVKWYYIFELGWYIHSQIYLMAFESETGQKRADFIAMTIHHIATLLLVSFSYLMGYSPVGCLIMLVHDVVDIPLEAALLFKEMGLSMICDIAFVTFAVFWAIFRLGIFPFYLVWTCFFDIPVHSPMKEGHPRAGTYTSMWDFVDHYPDVGIQMPYTLEFTALLFVLVALHIYWWIMIVRMIKRYIYDGHVKGDIREDADQKKKD